MKVESGTLTPIQKTPIQSFLPPSAHPYAAVAHNSLTLDDLDEDKLLEELRKLDKDKREAYIKEQIAKRKKIQDELSDLEKQRSAYIKERHKKAAAFGMKDGFDVEVEKMIREQGTRKGIVYD